MVTESVIYSTDVSLFVPAARVLSSMCVTVRVVKTRLVVETFVQSFVLSLLLLFLHAPVDFFQHSQAEVRVRGRNKEWHLFLLAYPKTAFVSVTMVLGY